MLGLTLLVNNHDAKHALVALDPLQSLFDISLQAT